MYIYKTTNLITNEFYIGLSTKHNPNYSGSGEVLKQQMSKYGEDNFRTSRIADLFVDFGPTEKHNKKALEKVESMCIQMHLSNPLCINISKGSYREKEVEVRYKEKIVYVENQHPSNSIGVLSLLKRIISMPLANLFSRKPIVNSSKERNNFIDKELLYSVKEVNEILGIHPRKLHRVGKKHGIKKVDNRYIFKGDFLIERFNLTDERSYSVKEGLNNSYYTVNEVANMLGTRHRAIQRRCVRANIGVVNGVYMIPKGTLQKWIEKLNRTKGFNSSTMMPLAQVAALTGIHYKKMQRRANKEGVKKYGKQYMINIDWVKEHFPEVNIKLTGNFYN